MKTEGSCQTSLRAFSIKLCLALLNISVFFSDFVLMFLDKAEIPGNHVWGTIVSKTFYILFVFQRL